MVFATHFHLGGSGQLLVGRTGIVVTRRAYGGEDAPVLGGQVAQCFGVELHFACGIVKMIAFTEVVEKLSIAAAKLRAWH